MPISQRASFAASPEQSRRTEIETFVFRIRLHDPIDDDAAERVYEGFEDEVAVESGPKGHFVGFERQATSFLEAVLDALAEVIELDFEPLAVEDELVSMADIAERTRRSRQSISMLASGRRGDGHFPSPVAGNVRSPLWHWADVAAWFESHEGQSVVSEDRMRTIASINGALANRVLAREQPATVREIQRRLAG
jgi:predicted DNA-binding transcriptional regulator AlpA